MYSGIHNYFRDCTVRPFYLSVPLYCRSCNKRTSEDRHTTGIHAGKIDRRIFPNMVDCNLSYYYQLKRTTSMNIGGYYGYGYLGGYRVHPLYIGGCVPGYPYHCYCTRKYPIVPGSVPAQKGNCSDSLFVSFPL